jgi:hypothetical protein
MSEISTPFPLITAWIPSISSHRRTLPPTDPGLSHSNQVTRVIEESKKNGGFLAP